MRQPRISIPARLGSAAREVRDLIIASEAPIARPDRQQRLTEAAAALSRTLLGPVAAQLGSKHLLIVADGALQYLPFAALPKPGVGEWESGRAGERESRRIRNPQSAIRNLSSR